MVIKTEKKPKQRIKRNLLTGGQQVKALLC